MKLTAEDVVSVTFSTREGGGTLMFSSGVIFSILHVMYLCLRTIPFLIITMFIEMSRDHYFSCHVINICLYLT